MADSLEVAICNDNSSVVGLDVGDISGAQNVCFARGGVELSRDNSAKYF